MFSALGQDTIDALFWTATEPKPNGRRKREHLGVLAHFLLTIVYVILHTLLVLLQATTLNVAINASNKALLTIMMSNNVRPFVLLQGSPLSTNSLSTIPSIVRFQIVLNSMDSAI